MYVDIGCEALLVCTQTNIGSAYKPRVLCTHSHIGAGCREPGPLFRVLRHHAPSSPICLSEVFKQALRLIARIPLVQRREKHRSREEKSAFK